MGETRREELLRELDARLAATDALLAARYPGPATGRHPVHTVYVPADRYDAGTVADWGAAGAAALAEHGGDDAELARVLRIPATLLRPVRERVVARFLVTYAFFREGAPSAVARLRAYRAKAESGVMDEPATERALVAYLERGVGCGALDADEVEV